MSKKEKIIYFIFLSFIFLFFIFQISQALPRGAILYKTSAQGKMYGLNYKEVHFPIFDDKGFYPGDVGLYLGEKDGQLMILQIRQGRVREIPAQYFVNSREGEKFVGVKIPKDFKSEQIRHLLEISRSQLGEKYDWSYKEQKGPSDYQWTSVGLVEKIYESLNNPLILSYYSKYTIDITPDGFDNTSLINEIGDCFSRDKEFSKIHRLEDEGITNFALIETVKNLASQLIDKTPFDLSNFDVNIFGKKYEGENYIFFPYTQYVQPTLISLPLDIEVVSREDYSLDIDAPDLKKEKFIAFSQRIAVQLAGLGGEYLLKAIIPGDSILATIQNLKSQFENLEDFAYFMSKGKIDFSLEGEIKEQISSQSQFASLTQFAEKAEASIDSIKESYDYAWKMNQELKDKKEKEIYSLEEKEENLDIDSYQPDKKEENIFSQIEQGIENISLPKEEPEETFFQEGIVVINEIYPWPESGENEWLELYNDSYQPLTLDDWTIEDNTNRPTKLDGLIIEGKGFLVLEREKIFNFNLNNQGDILTLKYKGEVIDKMGYGEKGEAPYAQKSCSLARFFDGQDRDNDRIDFYLTINPTPGKENKIISLPQEEESQEEDEFQESASQEDNESQEENNSEDNASLEEDNDLSDDENNLQEYEYLDLVISEIAWMGTKASPQDEWIELYNNYSEPIELDGFTLKAIDGCPEISLSGIIAPYSYFLLERTDDQTIKSISADQIYSGSLSNSGEYLVLRDGLGNIIDIVNNQEKWIAGNLNEHSSMERIELDESSSSVNWHTFSGTPFANDALGNFILGTPKRENSPYLGEDNNSDEEEPEDEDEPEDEEDDSSPQTEDNPQENDQTPPLSSLISHPSAISNDSTAEFIFEANEPATFQCSLDNGPWQDCSSPQFYFSLLAGEHTFRLRAKDEKGNLEEQPLEYKWLIDLEGPISSIKTSGYFSSSNWPGEIRGEFAINTLPSTSSTLALSDIDKVLVSVQEKETNQYLTKENEEFSWQNSPNWILAEIDGNNWFFSLDKQLLEEGTYNIWSKAYDLAGNEQDPLGFSQFIFDNTPPQIAEDFFLNIQEDGRQVQISWPSFNDNLSAIDFYRFSWKKDDDIHWQVLEQKETYLSLELDWGSNYSFRLEAQDKSGNLSLPYITTYFSNLPQILISEIQVGDREFVELYNSHQETVSLSGFYFAYYSYSQSKNDWDSPWRVKEFPQEAQIKPGGYYLIGLEGYPLPRSDWQVYSSSQLNNENGAVVLYSFNPEGKDKEYLKDNYIDLIAWGDGLVKEGNSCLSPYDKNKEVSLERKPGYPNGHFDSDNNQEDFFIQQEPNPTNSENLTSPGQWLWDWEKRQEIKISNQSTQDLEDYQVKVDIEFKEGMQKDFSDLRFTAEDGKTLLSFWREEYISEESARFWIKIPFIPSGEEKTIYYYWHNPSATYTGDPQETFVFYDDFVSNRLDEYEIIGDRNRLELRTADSLLRFDRKGQSWLLYPKNLEIKNFVLEIKGNVPKGQSMSALWRYQDENNYYLFGGGEFTYNSSIWWKKKEQGEEVSLVYDSETPGIRPSLIQVRAYDTLHHIDYWAEGSNTPYSYEKALIELEEQGKIGVSVKAPSSDVFLDYIKVRKYSQPEPEVDFGELEEKIMIANPSIEDGEFGFSSDWQKRAKIIINNLENRNSLNDYPILISISHQDGMAQDFSDLRFTAEDGKTLLSYYFEKCIDGKVDVWVKIPHIPSLGRTAIYVYWQNPSATYRGDAKNVFLHYDDFDDLTKDDYIIDGDINYAFWETANSQLRLKGNERKWFFWPKDLILSDFVMEVKGNFGNCSNVQGIWRAKDENNYYSFGGQANNYTWNLVEGGKEYPLSKSQAQENVNWFKVSVYQTKHSFQYKDETETYSFQSNGNIFSQPGKIGFFFEADVGDLTIDSLLVRPFTQPQPTYQWQE